MASEIKAFYTQENIDAFSKRLGLSGTQKFNLKKKINSDAQLSTYTRYALEAFMISNRPVFLLYENNTLKGVFDAPEGIAKYQDNEGFNIIPCPRNKLV